MDRGERQADAERLAPRRWSSAWCKLVSYVSHFITLHAGDVIATGTPPGVGMGMKPEPIFLQGRSDVMRLSVEGLGRSRRSKLVAG